MKQVCKDFLKEIPESLKQSRKRHRLPTEPLIGPKGDNLQQASIGWGPHKNCLKASRLSCRMRKEATQFSESRPEFYCTPLYFGEKKKSSQGNKSIESQRKKPFLRPSFTAQGQQADGQLPDAIKATFGTFSLGPDLTVECHTISLDPTLVVGACFPLCQWPWN
jgi:hypothetical protein